MSSTLQAWQKSNNYVGVFGGAVFSDSIQMYQMGTVFFTEAEGGPLAVFAQGRVKSNTSGFGGVNLGYEWCCSGWALSPGIELEAFYYTSKREGSLSNPTDRLLEHEFADSFRCLMKVFLLNAILTGDSDCYGFSPYIGAGIGMARINIKNAASEQIDPAEIGINHFNSLQNDASWTVAAQFKTGLKYEICQSVHIFGEYRYLIVDCSKYVLGSTVYPTHAATSHWNIKLEDSHHHVLSVGIRYDM